MKRGKSNHIYHNSVGVYLRMYDIFLILLLLLIIVWSDSSYSFMDIEILCVYCNYRYPIYSLGFGEGADNDFLKKLSLNNTGFARVIYEASDASLQLRNFYKEISSPVLSNVTFKYIDTQVKT